MAESSMNYLYTVGGYVTLIGVGYAIYHVSTQQQARKRGSSFQVRSGKASQPEPRKEDRKKKQRKEAFAQDAHEVAGKSITSKSSELETSAWSSVTKDDMDDSKANREFAKQLAKAKEGTKFAAKSEGKNREKSVKQSRANKISSRTTTEQAAETSDELPTSFEQDVSSVEENDEIPAEAGRVDDMLEPKQSGPSVLRLTESTPKEGGKKSSKAPEKVETKKQRQNRKKAEAAKALRQDTEVERKALEEKQRRQARIAEGRAAKDGSQFFAANPATSAWNKGAPTNSKHSQSSTNGSTNGFHQPLDTFEPGPAPTTAAVAAPGKSTNVESEEAWISSLPSEEEQIKLLQADDDWSMVKTKSKKKGPSTESGDESSKARPESKAALPTVIANQMSQSNKAKNFGSFSALTTDDTVDNEEEEWEV